MLAPRRSLAVKRCAVVDKPSRPLADPLGCPSGDPGRICSDLARIASIGSDNRDQFIRDIDRALVGWLYENLELGELDDINSVLSEMRHCADLLFDRLDRAKRALNTGDIWLRLVFKLNPGIYAGEPLLDDMLS